MAKIIFMGTPSFATLTLKKLIDEHTVMGIVTQPDRRAGRKQPLQLSAVKQMGLDHKIPMYQPETLRSPIAIDALTDMGIPDIYVVAAFGQILPPEVLAIPVYGSLNVHASLLPRWRGAAPIQAAIQAGDTETGITIMKMDAGLDTGPILTQQAIPIAPNDTGQTLHDRLAVLGAELMSRTLPQYITGEIDLRVQDSTLATLAPQINKADGHINWDHKATSIERQVRAFDPWPGTFTYWQDKRLKILQASVTDGYAPKGHVVSTSAGVAVGTEQGLLYVWKLQLQGGNPLTIDEFIHGHQSFVGSTLS